MIEAPRRGPNPFETFPTGSYLSWWSKPPEVRPSLQELCCTDNEGFGPARKGLRIAGRSISGSGFAVSGLSRSLARVAHQSTQEEGLLSRIDALHGASLAVQENPSRTIPHPVGEERP